MLDDEPTDEGMTRVVDEVSVATHHLLELP